MIHNWIPSGHWGISKQAVKDSGHKPVNYLEPYQYKDVLTV